MTKKRQYQLLMIAALALTVYLFDAEVVERWKGTLQLYDDLVKKERTSLNTNELSAKKSILQNRKRLLADQLAVRSQTFEQTQAGLVRFLNAQARTNGFRFESLVPKELRVAGRLKEIGLTVDFQATYHQAGAFFNGLETGPFPFGIDRADLVAKEAGSSLLQVRLEGRVALPRGAEP